MKSKKETFLTYSPSKSTRSESTYQAFEKNTYDQSFESEKTVYILIQNKKIPIKIEKTEEDYLTCGWLLSEAIRRITDIKEKGKKTGSLAAKIFDKEKIIYLESKEKIIGVDYLLSCLDEKISYLKDGIVLLPRFSGIFINMNVYLIQFYPFLKKKSHSSFMYFIKNLFFSIFVLCFLLLIVYFLSNCYFSKRNQI